MGDKIKFWTEDLCSLFTQLTIFPTKDMTKNEKLNALTRLIIVVTAVLYALDYKYWMTFLLVAIVIILLLKYAGKSSSAEEKHEGFTMTPTYSSTDFEQTTVTPLMAEEWQIPPPSYDMVTNNVDCCSVKPFTSPGAHPQSYPYGQYLTKTNLLPCDQYYIDQGCGSAANAREYANSFYLRNDLAFRDNMTKLYKKSLSRRFKNSCNDLVSPFMSY
jgi:hypothetical protein